MIPLGHLQCRIQTAFLHSAEALSGLLDDEKYYVSFWNSGDDYFVYTADEMDEYLSQQTGQGFSGM